MTITLPIQPQEEAKLIAIAQAKGVSPDALLREALDQILDKILADAPDQSEEPIVNLYFMRAQTQSQKRSQLNSPEAVERFRKAAKAFTSRAVKSRESARKSSG